MSWAVFSGLASAVTVATFVRVPVVVSSEPKIHVQNAEGLLGAYLSNRFPEPEISLITREVL